MQTDLRRASRAELDRNRRWDLAAVWDVECSRVYQWVRSQAAARLGNAGGASESVAGDANALHDQIRSTFSAEGTQYDPELLLMAQAGELQRQAPATHLLSTIRFFAWTAASCNMAIFVWQWLTRLVNGFVVVIGIVLISAAWLAGRGWGRLLVADRHESGNRAGAWAAIVTGSFIVLFLTWVGMPARPRESFLAWIVTTLLTITVAVLAAIDHRLHATAEELQRQMFLCQLWYSTQQHRRFLDQGVWRGYYAESIAQMEGKLREMFSTALGQPSLPAAPSENNPPVEGAD